MGRPFALGVPQPSAAPSDIDMSHRETAHPYGSVKFMKRPKREGRLAQMLPVEYPYGGPVGSEGWRPNSPSGALPLPSLPRALNHPHQEHAPEEDAPVERRRHVEALYLPDVADDLEQLVDRCDWLPAKGHCKFLGD